MIYRLLLIVILLLLPISGAAQQTNDITKPTRTRVTDKNKKGDQQQNAKGKDVKNNAKNTDSKATDTKAADKKSTDTKAADKKSTDNKAVDKRATDTKTAEKKENKPADNKPVPKPVSENKQGADTSAKPAASTKPKKVPVPAETAVFDGIDISRHQGSINWEELKKYTKIQFVYIKATEGSNMTDPKYKENIRNARKHGFKVGSYHYFTDLSGARQQFQNFIQVANRDEQDLVPVIDVEKLGKWNSQQLRDSVKVFADLIEDYYGCKPMIYTFETFFNKHLGKSFEKYPIFIAKYPKGQEQPNINGVKWVLWQFSECGKFKGVRDNLVDMSRFNKGYSLEDIIYRPGKGKRPKPSVKDAVDHKEKPSSVNMTEQKGKNTTTKQTKRQQEEAQRKAEREKKVQEQKELSKKKAAEQEAKKQANAERKAKEKAEARAKQEAREKAAKAEAEAKAKRKAEARDARKQAESQKSSKSSGNKSANLLQSTNTKLTQSQRNDSIRAAKAKGRKINKSSADND